MKKICITLLILLFTVPLFAPNVKESIMTILSPSPIEPYDKIIRAVVLIESSGDTLAYNSLEQAVGAFQIRPIRLCDYNQRTNKNYKLKDCYNFKISKEIFLYYAEQIGYSDYETIAKNWNGSGKATLVYWNKIKKQLVE